MLVAVVSDTHGQTREVNRALADYPLDALFFLGDYYMDSQAIAETLPVKIPVFAIKGNGDAFLGCDAAEEATVTLGGKIFFLVHGHRHQVKKQLESLLLCGERAKADVVLYGHTHIPFLAQQSCGRWIMNPGSASFPRGIEDATFGLLEWEEGKDIKLMIVDVATRTVLYTNLDMM